MMTGSDWNLLLNSKSKGFEILTYKKNEYIVKEGIIIIIIIIIFLLLLFSYYSFTHSSFILSGQKHHRIYKISSGSCRVEKNVGDGTQQLLTVLYPKCAPDAEVFGELTFTDPKNQRATASVIANDDDTV